MKVLLIIRERQTQKEAAGSGPHQLCYQNRGPGERMYCDKGVLWLREEEKRGFLKAERERQHERAIHLGKLEKIRPTLSQSCHRHLSLSLSLSQHGIQVRNLSTKKFCQSYFLVIAPLCALVSLALQIKRSPHLSPRRGPAQGGIPH